MGRGAGLLSVAALVLVVPPVEVDVESHDAAGHHASDQSPAEGNRMFATSTIGAFTKRPPRVVNSFIGHVKSGATSAGANQNTEPRVHFVKGLLALLKTGSAAQTEGTRCREGQAAAQVDDGGPPTPPRLRPGRREQLIPQDHLVLFGPWGPKNVSTQ